MQTMNISYSLTAQAEYSFYYITAYKIFLSNSKAYDNKIYNHWKPSL
jgi:hypothetical protein